MMGAEPDFPADLFAVGLVALYLLEGAKPDAKALIQYFADHGTPGAPQGIPEPLWQVVATLLQPDPEARFRTATGARKALAAAAELLPEPGPDDELIEIFDQLGPLPPGFAEDGPEKRASGLPAGLGGPVGAGASEGGTAGQSVVGGSGEPGPHLVRSTPPPDPRHGTATGSPATPPDATPQPAPLSDTGSFPLPPPRPSSIPTPRSPSTSTSPQYVPHPPYGHQQQAPDAFPYEATHQLRSPFRHRPCVPNPPLLNTPPGRHRFRLRTR